MKKYRIESDLLGNIEIPEDKLWGIHTYRAIDNFNLSRIPVNKDLIKAFGEIKLGCFQTNKELGFFDDEIKANAIEIACAELAEGLLNRHIVVDSLQGGAGTSTNMNVNEVIANRALELINEEKGNYDYISPLNDVNLHQSTNDTYPSALKIAAIRKIRLLEQAVLELQESFQEKEKEFAHVVKIGRTQLQDAVLTTLGREMGAYSEAFNRDRWRLSKCEERLRVINIGGTAIGTGLGAPRRYIFRVVDKLRENTGIGLARAENLFENTQNSDVFAEVSGLLKTCAVSLLKISNDLRLMASGPDAGFAEITLPPRQAGSSIMPGKVNPVIPEASAQVAIKVIGNDVIINHAASAANLELNQFLPLIANCLLESIELLSNACNMLRKYCITGIKANEEKCKSNVLNSTAIITALIPAIGYEKANDIVKDSIKKGISVKDSVLESGLLNMQQIDQLISPEAVCRLGF